MKTRNEIFSAINVKMQDKNLHTIEDEEMSSLDLDTLLKALALGIIEIERRIKK